MRILDSKRELKGNLSWKAILALSLVAIVVIPSIRASDNSLIDELNTDRNTLHNEIPVKFTRISSHVYNAGPLKEGVSSAGADGEIIPYIEHYSDLWIRNVTTGKTTLLTHSDIDSGHAIYHPVISPDGKSVAYALDKHDTPDGGSSTAHLCILEIGKTQARIFDFNDQPQVQFFRPYQWSHDCSQLLALLFDKQDDVSIGSISTEDGTIKILKKTGKHEPFANLSIDGTVIYYDLPQEENANQADIYALDIETKDEHKLVEHRSHDRFLGRSPDGRYILFLSDRLGSTDMWCLGIDGLQTRGRPRLVKRNIGNGILPMGFSGSGAYWFGKDYGTTSGAPRDNLLERIQDDDVYVARFDPPSQKLLDLPTKIGQNMWPTWSEHGTWCCWTENVNELQIKHSASGKTRRISHKLNPAQ